MSDVYVPGYRVNEGGDAFMDAKGRVWHAEGGRRHELPRDPLECETIPPAFWHPKARKEWEAMRQVENATLRAELRIEK